MRSRPTGRILGQAMAEESTTPDLVERMRRSAEPANTGDFDAMMRFWAPSGVFDLSPMGLGTHEGAAAIRGFYEEWIGAYDDFRVEMQEGQPLGNGVVLAVYLYGARPAGSTGFVRIRYAAVSTWVNGLIVRTTTYTDIDEAAQPPNASPRNGGRRCRRDVGLGRCRIAQRIHGGVGLFRHTNGAPGRTPLMSPS